MTHEPAETYEHEGVEVKIMYDEDSRHADPRDCDNLGEMYLYRPGYELGDTELKSHGLPSIGCPRCGEDGHIAEHDCDRCVGMGIVEDPPLQDWLKANDVRAFMPLFIFEHSGMTISGGTVRFIEREEVTRADTDPRRRFMGDDAGWDTSFSGFLVITNEKLKAEGMADTSDENLAEIMQSEVEAYAMYLEGRVYGYIVAEDTPFEDSCWGFLGDEHVKQEANGAAKYAAEQLANERNERAEWAARDVMTCG